MLLAAFSIQPTRGPGNANGPDKNDKENIVDADFTEVDDETGRKKSA
jgi:hypothetical protein